MLFDNMPALQNAQRVDNKKAKKSAEKFKKKKNCFELIQEDVNKQLIIEEDDVLWQVSELSPENTYGYYKKFGSKEISLFL